MHLLVDKVILRNARYNNKDSNIHVLYQMYTVMCRLTTGIHTEKCGVRRYRHRPNVTEYTYTNLDSIAYYTPSLYGIAYCS